MKTQTPSRVAVAQTDAPVTEIGTRVRWMGMLCRHFKISSDDQRRKRLQRRFDVENTIAEVLLDSMERPEDAAPLTMTVVDVSPGGVMLRSFDPLERGTGMAMRFKLGPDDVTLMGRVMHCTPTLGGYKVGIKLLF